VKLADEKNWNNKTKIQNLASKLASSHLVQSLRLLVSIHEEWDFERCCKHILELEESLAKAKPINVIHFQNHFLLYPHPNPQGYQQLGGQPIFALQQQPIGPVGMAPPTGPSEPFHGVCYRCREPGHKGFECPYQMTKDRFYNKNAQSDPAYYHPTANKIPPQLIRNAPPEEGRQWLTTPEVNMVQQLLDESKKRKVMRVLLQKSTLTFVPWQNKSLIQQIIKSIPFLQRSRLWKLLLRDRNSNLEEVCSVELGKKEPVRKPLVSKERIVRRRQEMHKSPYWQHLGN
jgi:hypothetical protein